MSDVLQHHEVERALRSVPVGQVTEVFGVPVYRPDVKHYVIANDGIQRLMLEAMDQLMQRAGYVPRQDMEQQWDEDNLIPSYGRYE